jgi:predicted nucleotidyltransferase
MRYSVVALATAAALGLLPGCLEEEEKLPFTSIPAGLTGVCSSSLAWGDYDNDGDLDLALAGDSTPAAGGGISKVYRNDVGMFADIGAGLTGVFYGSLAWGDYDNDGDLDLALAGPDGTDHYAKVYDNDGGTFTEIGAGLTGVFHGSLAWGDYDNDGDLDLALAGLATSGDTISKVYRNDGGTFTDIGAGLGGVERGFIVWGDYDNDGDLDLALGGGRLPRHQDLPQRRRDVHRHRRGAGWVRPRLPRLGRLRQRRRP